MADGKVEWDLVAKADQAIRELKDLGESTDKVAGAFTTMAGTAKRRLMELGTDSAVALGQQVAGDVLEAAGQIEILESKIETAFGAGPAKDAMMSWASDVKGLFGEGSTSVVSLMGDLANKLDLDGRNAADMGMLQGIGELGGVLSTYFPQLGDTRDVLEEITNYLATGEAGQLEDVLGDLGGATLTLAERQDLLKEKAGPAWEAYESGALDSAMAMEELQAMYDDFINGLAGVAIAVKEWADGIVEDHKRAWTWVKEHPITEFLSADLGKIPEGMTIFDFTEERASQARKHVADTSDAMGGDIAAILDASDTMRGEMAKPLPTMTADVDSSEIDAALAKVLLLQSALGGVGGGQPGGTQSFLDPQVDPNAAYAEADRRAAGKTQGDQGRRISMTVNVSPGTDPSEVGRQIVSSIAAYERANTQSWRSFGTEQAAT